MDVIGRSAELDQLQTWLHGGVKTVLVIEGEPGIGKTTLWAEGVDQARLKTMQILACRPRPSDARLPNVGVTDSASRSAGRSVREPPAPAAEIARGCHPGDRGARPALKESLACWTDSSSQ